jgi:hypothetical protein
MNSTPNLGSSSQSSSVSDSKSKGKRCISQLDGPLPSSSTAKRKMDVNLSEQIQQFIDKTAEDLLYEADSQRSKRSVHDYSFVITYDMHQNIEFVTLPSHFNEKVTEVDKLIAFLLKVCDIPAHVEKSNMHKGEETVPDLLSQYISGIVLAFASEAKLPTVWKEKDKAVEVAKQAVLWKRFMGYFVQNEMKLTHQFRFCAPSVSGDGEKTAFNKFYTLLSKQDGVYSEAKAKLIKTLIQVASVARAFKDVDNVLDAHKISVAEISREAKPQTEDKSKKRRKDAAKTYVVKTLWDPETFPFLTHLEKLHLKERRKVHTSRIKTVTDQWNTSTSIYQYTHYKEVLKTLKDLYTKYYQEVDRMSTSLHRRRMLFESYLRRHKLSDPQGTKLLKSTVAHYESEKANPKKTKDFAIVMDPRNVLQPATHYLVTNRTNLDGNADPVVTSANDIVNEFFHLYPHYITNSYTDNIAICKTTNAFSFLSVDENAQYDEDEAGGNADHDQIM